MPITDSLMLHDTVLVNLPTEQRQYSDPRYTAWVSGYRPQLDSIRIYQQTEYITKEVKGVATLSHQTITARQVQGHVEAANPLSRRPPSFSASTGMQPWAS